ncbi:hypothetical protein [Pararhizobium sp. A13]|uniref:hypothetical protein n=1 Tax=Pararhizobium sp. A13 TaxID=3133975 RepID=UPI0032506CC3
MFGRFVSLSLLLIIAIPHQSFGDDIELAMRRKIVVGDGPFEIKDEGGVIGFIVATAGNSVTFKPCTGESFSLNRDKLLRTKNKCKDAPSPDENPLVANCGDAWDGWDKTKVVQAIKGDEPVGTTFFSTSDNEIFAQAMDPTQMAAAMDSVAQLKDCGQYTIGFDTQGKINLSIVQPMQAIRFDNQN